MQYGLCTGARLSRRLLLQYPGHYRLGKNWALYQGTTLVGPQKESLVLSQSIKLFLPSRFESRPKQATEGQDRQDREGFFKPGFT
jgi:hypothetical protein